MQALWRRFWHKYVSQEQAVILLLMCISSTLLVVLFGRMLIPLLAAMVLAFLLEGGVEALMRFGMPRSWAMPTVYLLFLGVVSALLVVVLPLLWNQAVALTSNLPLMLLHSQQSLYRLPRLYPHLVSQHDISIWLLALQAQMGGVGQKLIALSPYLLGHLIAFSIYIVMIPTLVFFLLKDRQPIHDWMSARLPRHHPALSQIAQEINRQLYRYIRGKLIEVLLVTVATYIVFVWTGLSYAFLLAMAVGLSVIIPYIGAVVVTIPVVLVAFFEWGGLSDEFWRVLMAHLLIQLIDGNLLVPLLFAEAVALHPIVIIVAIIIFGGWWGLWGVFFAIPLAVVLRVLAQYWPVQVEQDPL